MADVLMWFLLVVGIIIVLNSYWLSAAALAPGAVELCQAQYQRPLRVTLIGIAGAVPLVVLAILCFRMKHPVGNLIGLACIGGPIVLGMAGSAGFARRIGLGLKSDLDAQQPWRTVLRGGIVFAFTMLLPFIGWFVVLPWALLSGFGAMLLVSRERRRGSPGAAAGDARIASAGAGLDPAAVSAGQVGGAGS